MDYQRPDPENGSNGARVEDDFIKPLRPMKSISHRRLPAALPFALAGILVVSSVAFGATIVRNLVLPSASATPVVVGDDDPTEAPTLEITEAPSVEPSVAPTQEPTVAPTAEPSAPAEHVLTLAATVSGNKVKIDWTRYQGEDFAYYKVVRSTDELVSWPLGAGDKLVAAISDIDTLTFTDCPPAGTTVYFQVFAVKNSESGYETLADSNIVSVKMPAATPRPASTCSISLTARLITPTASSGGVNAATVSGTQVKLTWTKYRCDNFNYYGVVRAEGAPTLAIDGLPNLFYTSNQGTLQMIDPDNKNGSAGPLLPGHTYKYRVWAFSEKKGVTAAGQVNPACYVGSILAVSNIVTVTIPAV
jgi:hypothetical protein